MKERALKCTNPEISFFHIDEHSKFEIPNEKDRISIHFGLNVFFLSCYSVVLVGNTHFFFGSLKVCLSVVISILSRVPFCQLMSFCVISDLAFMT